MFITTPTIATNCHSILIYTQVSQWCMRSGKQGRAVGSTDAIEHYAAKGKMSSL